MRYVTELTNFLQDHLLWHKARLKFMARYVGALLKQTTVNGSKLAKALNPRVKTASNYRRIQRFMAGFAFDFETFGRLLLHLLPQRSDYIVIMDRTQWKFGRTPINVLMIAVAYKGIAWPVLWSLLEKEGSSNTGERKALLRTFFQILGPEQIRAFVADREFIGDDWLQWLEDRHIPYVIRIRSNQHLALEASGSGLPARMFFRGLPAGKTRHLIRYLGHRKVHVLGQQLEDDYLVLITNQLPGRALALYRRRWEIETLFGALKSRGFNLEETHMREPKRLGKLIGLLSLAFVWAHVVGQWRAENEGPPPVKNHGYPGRSLFRYGLDRLETVFLNLAQMQRAFDTCLQVLTQPNQFLSCS